jgi:hypothetical protein
MIQKTPRNRSGGGVMPLPDDRRLTPNERGEIVLLVDGKKVTINPTDFPLEAAFGSLSLPRPLTDEELEAVISLAKEEKAAREIAKLRRS